MAFTPEQLSAAQAYLQKHPDQLATFQKDYAGDMNGWLTAFTNWWTENGAGVTDLSPHGDELRLINALGGKIALQPGQTGLPPDVQAVTGSQSVPLEQGLLDSALPGIQADIAKDAERRTVADNLATSATQGATAATTQLARTQGGHFDGKTYLAQNPDVAAAFAGAKQANPGLDINTFAEQHFLENGQREGRKPAYVQSAQLAQEFANTDQATAASVSALSTATNALQQNLTGDLANRAAALQQQIQTLGSNLDQLDATQRSALAAQISATQANLEQSVAAQKIALQNQVEALGGIATAEAAARKTALEQEIAGLNAAQQPLADARVKAAQLQATAVNVGLERTRDQLTANNARAGYVGGSTAQDAAMTRATVDARQRSAEAIGGAQTANAIDTRDIGARGASGQRTIADALTSANRDIAATGATGNYNLTSGLATGTRTIADAGAAGAAGITNQTAQSRAGIGALNANTQFADQVFGADQKRSIGDALASGNYSLATQGTAAKTAFQNADFGRTMNASLALTAVPQNLVTTLNGLDNYANSGLNRAQNTLNWWSTGSGAAPTPGITPVQPSNTGNDISNLGAGVANAALNKWWNTPAKPKVDPAAGLSINT